MVFRQIRVCIDFDLNDMIEHMFKQYRKRGSPVYIVNKWV